MPVYRTTRNIEASLIDFLRDKLDEYNWSGVSVIKGFKRVEKTPLPVIAIIADDTYYNRTGIGENATFREVSVRIHLFASSDGQRLDLKDFIIDVLKISAPYYEYIIENGQVVSKNYICQMFTRSITDRKLYNIENISDLDVYDRYRHFINIVFSLPMVEGVR